MNSKKIEDQLVALHQSTSSESNKNQLRNENLKNELDIIKDQISDDEDDKNFEKNNNIQIYQIFYN